MDEFEQISFPEKEWTFIKINLKENGTSSTIRSCNELGKFKKGQKYLTPWKDIIQIKSVTRFSKAENIPTWYNLTKSMKISCKKAVKYGNSLWDYIVFEKT